MSEQEQLQAKADLADELASKLNREALAWTPQSYLARWLAKVDALPSTVADTVQVPRAEWDEIREVIDTLRNQTEDTRLGDVILDIPSGIFRRQWLISWLKDAAALTPEQVKED